MNGFTRTPRHTPAFRLLVLGWMAIGAGLYRPGLLEASPIHRAHGTDEALELREERAAERTRAAHAESVAHPGIFRSWPEFLLGGPSVWSTLVYPPVTRDAERAIWHALKSDRAESSPWVEFLVYKRSLDQARFDHFHPRVAKALERLSVPQAGTLATGSGSTATSTGGGTGAAPVQSQQIGPNPVPEPGSWLIAIGLAGWGLWWRRRAG